MPELRLIVEEEYSDIRADQYLSLVCPLSRSQIQKLTKEGKISLNGDAFKNKVKVAAGDVFDVTYEEHTLTDLVPEDIPLDVVYEDADLIVINKPKGLVVHPAPGNPSGTLVNALLYHCRELSSVNGYYRPGIVHRIDKDTSGLLVCAKNDRTHAALAAQLQDKTCFRRYYAIVQGVIPNSEGEINAPIGRSEKDRQKMTVTDKNAKEAITLFHVLDRMDDATLLDVELKTGRTHQIRVHMAFIHHPVVNDARYGKKTIDESGQYLHAYQLSFIHPSTGERVTFTTGMPEYMKQYLREKGSSYERAE